MLSKDDAKNFIRNFEKQTNEGLKTIAQTGNGRPADRVTFKLKSVNPCHTRYTYNEVCNGHIIGCVVVGEHADGKIGIVAKWCSTPCPV